MQSNHYPLIYKKALFDIIKCSILISCCWFIYQKMSQTGFQIPTLDLNSFMLISAIVIFLIPLNWYLEALRWKLSIPFENISIRESMNIVLRGLAMNWVLPFTVGDVGSRLAEVKNKRMSSIAIGYNRFVILLITYTYGGSAVIFYLGESNWIFALLGVSTIFIVLVFILLTRKISSRVQVKFLTSRLAFDIVGITLIRYAIFTFQFYLLIRFFNPSLSSFVILMGIGWVFLFRSILPSLLGSIGVREASSIFFFQAYVTDLNLIVFPCLIIWVLNTIVPSIIGLIPVMNFKFNLAR